MAVARKQSREQGQQDSLFVLLLKLAPMAKRLTVSTVQGVFWIVFGLLFAALILPGARDSQSLRPYIFYGVLFIGIPIVMGIGLLVGKFQLERTRQGHSLNTIVSHVFRAAVAVYVVATYILGFSGISFTKLQERLMENDGLVPLMAIVVLLFIFDMTTPKAETRKYSKLVDFFIGCVWIWFAITSLWEIASANP